MRRSRIPCPAHQRIGMPTDPLSPSSRPGYGRTDSIQGSCPPPQSLSSTREQSVLLSTRRGLGQRLATRRRRDRRWLTGQ